jgi:peptidoglycan hydrolase CwlO-like protein
MEIDIEKQKGGLEKEISTLTGQLQQIDNQIAQLNQDRNNQVALILKKQGALELLQSLEKMPDL